MNKTDKVEIALICLATVLAAAATKILPRQLALGEIALAASALLLGQGLARDLWLKYGRKNVAEPVCVVRKGNDTPTGNRKPAACMCVESSIGAFGIVAGALALLSGASGTATLPVYFWPVLVPTVGFIGFAMKSLVIDWKARRIRIESDHSSVRFGK